MSSQLRVCSSSDGGPLSRQVLDHAGGIWRVRSKHCAWALFLNNLENRYSLKPEVCLKQWFFVRRAMKMMNAELERWELHVLFIHDRMPRVWNRQQTAIACRSKMIKYENLPVHAADHSNLAERCHTVILLGTSCVEILELRPWQGKMQRKRWFSFTLFTNGLPSHFSTRRWIKGPDEATARRLQRRRLLLGFSWIPVDCLAGSVFFKDTDWKIGLPQVKVEPCSGPARIGRGTLPSSFRRGWWCSSSGSYFCPRWLGRESIQGKPPCW